MGGAQFARAWVGGARDCKRMEALTLALFLFACTLSPSRGAVANLVLLPDAVKEGAVCLDGTAPGYYFRAGSGSGAKSWIVHMEGGGWCYDEDECVARSKTPLGSSKFWGPTAVGPGFLSDNQTENPDFYNWNVAYIKYCDGASFTGNVANPVDWKGSTIYFRGLKVLQANLAALLHAGMNSASEVILTGCSAGGLATYLHTDYVKSILPSSVKYRAMADAGYFIDVANITGQMHIRMLGQYASKMQNSTMGANQDCIAYYTSKGETWRCLSPQYSYPFIKSPIFVLNSQYDTWQLANILQLGCLPPRCSESQMKFFENFRNEFLAAAAAPIASQSNGVFLDSCLIHCQSLSSNSWNGYKVKGQTIRETFADWYFNRSGEDKEVDCAYPCNLSC